MSPITVMAIVGAALTVGGMLAAVAYQAGRLDARVESLEKWRLEMSAELTAIHTGIRRVELAIRRDDPPRAPEPQW